jgi:lipoprotein-releasing system permease protein
VFDKFAWTVAVRQLRFSVSQTMLTVGVVAASVTLIVFLSSLIAGLQKRLISVTTGSIPAIVISQPDPVPITLRDTSKEVYIVRKSGQELRKKKIEDWQPLLDQIRRFDTAITAASPVAEGQTILVGPAKRQGIQVVGVVPEVHNLVIDIESKLIEGRYYGLQPGDIAIGKKAAEDFGLRVGDRVNLLAQDGVQVSHRVAGIFKTGFERVDKQTVFTNLRDAQSLLGLGTAITSVDIKLSDVFDADEIARRLKLQVPYKVESWTVDNQQLLSALRAQTQSTRTIVSFTVVASGLSIASILITAVVSRLREIGILRAIGAKRGQILGVIVIQSAIVSVIGGLVGIGMGVGFSLLLYKARLATGGAAAADEVFPPALGWKLIAGTFALAVIVGLLAAVYPARRASMVNPIEVIRGS